MARSLTRAPGPLPQCEMYNFNLQNEGLVLGWPPLAFVRNAEMHSLTRAARGCRESSCTSVRQYMRKGLIPAQPRSHLMSSLHVRPSPPVTHANRLLLFSHVRAPANQK